MCWCEKCIRLKNSNEDDDNDDNNNNNKNSENKKNNNSKENCEDRTKELYPLLQSKTDVPQFCQKLVFCR